jgi:hypothetical protein
MTPHQPRLPDTTPDLANLSEAELSSNQEARVVPWIAGERKVAVTWITPIENAFSKKLPRPPNGIEDAFSVAMWFDVGAATLFGFDSLIKDATQPKTKFWYGSVAGIACCGPADEIVGLLVNGKTVWPGTKVWNDAIIDLPTVQRKRQSNEARLFFASAVGITHASKIIASGLSDASFDEAAPVAVTSHSDVMVGYGNVGPDVGVPTKIDDVGGRLSKVDHYLVNDIVRDGSAVWRCILAHDAMPVTRPPNATYWVPYSVQRASSPNPYPFTVVGFGQAYLYWGTSNQTLDATGEAILTQLGHPAYRNQVVLVLKDFLFGSSRSSAPSIELVLRRKPNQAVIAGGSSGLDADYQANGLAIVADMMAHPVFGLGQSSALLDAASWQAIADVMAAAASQVYVSPFIDKAVAFRTWLAEMMLYHDGWLRYNAAGLIEAGKFSHDEAPPAFTPATTIDYHDCIEEIAFESQGYAATFNSTVVKFKDRLRAFNDAGVSYESGFNRELVGEPRQSSLDRLSITRESQAIAHAAEWGKVFATPSLTGTLVVRAEKAAGIKQGDLFLLTHDAVQMSVVCRCIDKTLAAPPAGRVSIQFESERGIAPVPYVPTPNGPGGTILPPPGKVTLYQLWQPPPSLVGVGDFRISLLTARTSAQAHGVNLWFKLADGGSFFEVGQVLHFAVTGTLAADYAGNPGTMGILTRNRIGQTAYMRADNPTLTWNYAQPAVVSGVGGVGNLYDGDVFVYGIPTDPGVFLYHSQGPAEGTVAANPGATITPSDPYSTDDDSESLQLNLNELTLPADLASISETQTADSINDDQLLLIIFTAADRTQFEIMTVKNLRLDSGVYKFKVRRGRFWTLKRTFHAGDLAWIIHRRDIVTATHAQFASYAASGAAATFRLQAFTVSDQADLSDTTICPDVAFNFTDPYAPQISWPLLQSRGTSNRPPAQWPPTYSDDFADLGGAATVGVFDQFKFKMTVSSPDALVQALNLIARYDDGTEVLLLGKIFAPSKTAQATAIFVNYGVAPMQFPGYGPPTFIAVIKDTNNRTTEHVVPVVFTWSTPI